MENKKIHEWIKNMYKSILTAENHLELSNLINIIQSFENALKIVHVSLDNPKSRALVALRPYKSFEKINVQILKDACSMFELKEKKDYKIDMKKKVFTFSNGAKIAFEAINGKVGKSQGFEEDLTEINIS